MRERIHHNLLVVFLLIVSLSISRASNGGGRSEYSTKRNTRNNLEVLGLGPPFYQFWPYTTPTESDVKHAFHRLSLKYHPDKLVGSRSTVGLDRLLEWATQSFTTVFNAADQESRRNRRYLEIRGAYDALKGNSVEAELLRRNESMKFAHCGGTIIYIQYLVDVFLDAMRINWNLIRNDPCQFVYSSVNSIRYLSIGDLCIIIFKLWLLFQFFGFIRYLWYTYVGQYFRQRPLTQEEIREKQRAVYDAKQKQL